MTGGDHRVRGFAAYERREINSVSYGYSFCLSNFAHLLKSVRVHSNMGAFAALSIRGEGLKNTD